MTWPGLRDQDSNLKFWILDAQGPRPGEAMCEDDESNFEESDFSPLLSVANGEPQIISMAEPWFC